MPQLFVPVIVNDEIGKTPHKSLFSVTGKTMETTPKSNFEFNGWSTSNSNFEFISELDKKLENFFPNESFSFNVYEYGKNPIYGVFEDFTENTMSISLGILCSAYVIKEERKLKEKYDSITVTGNFNVIDGRIFLSEVTDIEEKYKAVQDYASKNADKKHLFLYVSSKETIPDGIQENNVHVIRYDGTFPVECVFAEVFEPSDIQKQSIQSLQQYKKEYLETASFIKWKKELIQSNCNGILLHGASNSGKTIAATNLCKYMIATATVEEISWITISDNVAFWDKLHKGFFPNFSKIIKEEFPDQFNMLDTLLRENKKCCLIVDNIEGDFTDRILSFIKDNYETALDKKILKIVITAWKNAEDKNVLQDLQLQEKNCETLMVHTDLKYIVYNAFENKGIEPLALKDFKENQNKLLKLFSEICSEGEKLFPGEVSNHIDSIAEIGIDSFIKRYSQDNFKKLTKKDKLFRINFEILDPMSQWVLFTFLGMNKFKKEIDIQKICEIINAKIFNRVSESAFVSEQNIIDAVEKLNRKEWIHEINSNSKVFYVKADTIDYCVFSDYEKDEIAKNLGLIRDILIPLDIRIKHAIQNDKFEIFKTLIKNFSDRREINEFFIRCIEYDRGMDYLKILDEKGIDPEYLDEDGSSAIDVVWCKDTDIDVLDYLLEKGFKPRKRIPIPENERNRLRSGEYVSPLMLTSDKGHIHLFKYALDNHLYDNIDDYVFQREFTILQDNTLIGQSVEIIDLLIKSGADISLKTNNGNGWSLLTCAVLNEKHPEILEYILKNYFYKDIDEKDKNGRTALHWACSKNTKSLELLLKYGADKGARDNRGKTILHHAAQNKDSTVLQHILEHHYYGDINETDNDGHTPLHYACEKGKNTESIAWLLEYKADRERMDNDGLTLLHHAAVNMDSTILRYVLNHHYYGDINEITKHGNTALHLACAYSKDANSIELLLEYKANLEIRDNNGVSLLHHAAKNYDSVILRHILKHHYYADINETSNNGATPLHYACVYSKNTNSIELLLEYGADQEARDNSGRTLLHCAAVNKDSSVLRYVLKHYCYNNIDETDKDGKTALGLAKTLESFKLLLEHGAAPEIITTKGNNILHSAVINNNPEIVEYILKNLLMVDPMLKNSDGKTPADFAKSDDIKKLFEKL